MACFAETDASQPDVQRVIECLKRAQQTYEATPAAERGLPPGDAVRELAACAMPLASALCHIHDATRLRALRELLSRLRSLAPVLDMLIADLRYLGRPRDRARDRRSAARRGRALAGSGRRSTRSCAAEVPPSTRTSRRSTTRVAVTRARSSR